MKRISWVIGLAFLLLGCSSSAGGIEAANLESGTYTIQIASDETYVFVGEGEAIQTDGDIRWEVQLNDANGLPFATLTFAMPPDLAPDTYQICYLDFYDLGQCNGGYGIGVEYRQMIEDGLVRQTEFGSGSVELISTSPLTASFRLAPTFDSGAGAIVTGAMNQIPIH